MDWEGSESGEGSRTSRVFSYDEGEWGEGLGGIYTNL